MTERIQRWIQVLERQLPPDLLEKALSDLDACLEGIAAQYAHLAKREFTPDPNAAEQGVAYWIFNTESSSKELREQLPRMRAQGKARADLELRLITKPDEIKDDSVLRNFVKREFKELNDAYKKEYGRAYMVIATLPNATNIEAYEELNKATGACSSITEDGFFQRQNPVTIWQWDDIYVRNGTTMERLT